MNSNQTASTPKPPRHVVVIGLGNIGSPLVDLLARMGTVGQLTLVDRDIYEDRNLGGQAILPEDVGRPKVDVQADHVRRINSSMTVIPVHASAEDVPLGQFRSDVIVACLDSKLARQWVNQIAWRLNTPWIDGGVASELPQNYVALCPVCAAKFRHANATTPEELKENILSATGSEVPVTLARKKSGIVFTRIHLLDLQSALRTVQ